MNKIFGLGLSKTGTSSLSEALNRLGYKTLHYPEDEETRREIYRFYEGASQHLRLSLLDRYDGLIDTPVCAIYKALDCSYPGSKFILTVREKHGWLQSIAEHRERAERRRVLPGVDPELWAYVDYMRKRVYGTTQYDPAIFSAVYDAHYQDVVNYFCDRPQDLLVVDIVGGSGWDVLCPFLGVSAPEIPFPWLNRSASPETHRGLRDILWEIFIHRTFPLRKRLGLRRRRPIEQV